MSCSSDEDLDVEDVAQLLRLEDQDALDDDDMARLDNDGFLRAVVLREIIDGAFDTVSFTQFLEVLDEQIRLKGVGVVVVDRLTLLEGQVVVRCIVVIVINHRDFVAEVVLEAIGERGLSGARAAGNADNRGFHTVSTSLSIKRKRIKLCLSYHISSWESRCEAR